MKNTISQKKYRKHVSEFISQLQTRPEMSYKNLHELTMIMHGHYVSFWQLGYEGKSFNESFAHWLNCKKAISVCQGWGNAIEKISCKDLERTQGLFEQLITEFFQEWS